MGDVETSGPVGQLNSRALGSSGLGYVLAEWAFVKFFSNQLLSLCLSL